jgi:solute carrier family 25 phosphate transporter 3
MVKATMKIVKNDGIQTLLAGLGPTAWGYLLEGAVKFGIYEVLKPAVRQMLVWLATATSIASLNNKILGFVICGGVSGVGASLMLCPMEALRIRLVSEPDFDRGGGWVNGFLRMLKYEGVGGLWKGINAMMLKQGKLRFRFRCGTWMIQSCRSKY